MAVLYVGFIHGVTLLMSISNLISLKNLNYELISTQHIPIQKKKKLAHSIQMLPRTSSIWFYHKYIQKKFGQTPTMLEFFVFKLLC